MRYLKLNEEYIREIQITKKCNDLGLINWTLNPETGLVDVDGHVNISNRNLDRIPIRFGVVNGNFGCNGNKLESLDGSPQEVFGKFYCNGNKLKSLIGGPKKAFGYNCAHNNLESLKGSPEKIDEFFFSNGNPLLINLIGSPKVVDGHFFCENRNLLSLEGIGEVSGIITISSKSPCYMIYGSWINGDRRDELLDLMEDYDFLRGEEIYWERLEAFYNDSGLEIPDRVELKKYYTIIE